MNQLKRFGIPSGFKLELWAAEPLLANPVAFCLDEQGRVFVSETHRYRSSVLDIRHYMFMLEDDLACRTVDDRVEMVTRHFGEKARDLAVETEVIRLLEDRSGRGQADFSSIYADGFNTVLDGIASGVLARKGKVWFTNIPELWQLEGINAAGKAVRRQSLSHGYGVRFSYTGHDMHGLIIGPDGRLYFSFGDRGAHVITKEGKLLDLSDEGAVFRCDLDGSNLELVHKGLRNPQELAFDDQGNLFTADNDCDYGDRERWIYVVEGGESGWRVGHQHAPTVTGGMWMMEKLWQPWFPGQAAYIVPPLNSLNDGPSGLAYYPGVGWGDSYQGHFFLCSFKGSAARSNIDTFRNKPRGASFELVGYTNFIGQVAATDVDFGPDGRLYFSDWGEGWERSGRGRIYRTFEPTEQAKPLVEQTRRLIAEGMDHRSTDELLKLLEHPDRRVRQEAQFTLADKGGLAVRPFTSVVLQSQNQIARLHALWGLGQIARKDKSVAEVFLGFLKDKDAEVRAHSARLLGDSGLKRAAGRLVPLLKDESLRVRYFAVQSLGKIGDDTVLRPLFALIRENESDLYLRHACVIALTRLAEPAQLVAAGKDSSTTVRMAALLAMRRLELSRISMFLEDKDPLLVAEAARAINDVPIEPAYPALAKLASGDLNDRPLMYRVLNANFRAGGDSHARTLVDVALRGDAPVESRVEALYALGVWARPPQRDRVVGIYRPLVARSSEPAAKALLSRLAFLLQTAPEPVQIAAVKAVSSLGLLEATDQLVHAFKEPKTPAKTRAALLSALGELKVPQMISALFLAETDPSDEVRKEAARWQTSINKTGAVAAIEKSIAAGSIGEKQAAIASLAKLNDPATDKLLVSLLGKLASGNVPKEIALELVESAAAHPAPPVKAALENYRATLGTGPLAKYQDTLFGGDAAAGKKVFYEKVEASCLRCHKVNGEGGEAGPDLSHIASRADRSYFLESIITPNAKIAAGFDSVIVTLKDGQIYAGILKTETDAELSLLSPEDGLVKVDKSKIQTREKGLSGMPEGVADLISRRDLRDVIEYLSTLK